MGTKKLKLVGIEEVRHLQQISDPDAFVLPQGLPRSTFKVVWQHAQEASVDPTPPDIDHRKAENPYISRYGDQWESYMRKSPTFANSVLITEYIDHMMRESALVMKGTKFEDNWRVYHDALSLMTSKDTKKWMDEKGYLEKWILPSENLYVNMPELQKIQQ